MRTALLDFIAQVVASHDPGKLSPHFKPSAELLKKWAETHLLNGVPCKKCPCTPQTEPRKDEHATDEYNPNVIAIGDYVTCEGIIYKVLTLGGHAVALSGGALGEVNVPREMFNEALLNHQIHKIRHS